MKATQKIRDLSYFTLRLQELLHQSYSDLAKDNEFVENRSAFALQTYTDAIIAGNNHLEASRLVNEVLFKDLPFSKFDMLFEVVCNEFDRDMADDKLRPFAHKMYPVCLPVFEKYKMTRDFKDSTTYDALYTELTGTVQLWLEENVIQ